MTLRILPLAISIKLIKLSLLARFLLLIFLDALLDIFLIVTSRIFATDEFLLIVAKQNIFQLLIMSEPTNLKTKNTLYPHHTQKDFGELTELTLHYVLVDDFIA